MHRRWGRKAAQLTMDEKTAMVERWKRREPTEAIARDYGVSPGQVSNIAIKEFGNPPHIKRNRRKAEQPAPAAERGVPAFQFDGMVVRRDGDAMCLTDLWRAAGGPENNRPADWLRKAGRLFAEHVSGMPGRHTDAVTSEIGGRNAGSTWADKHIALAYATDLSPALRLHVQEVFFAYVEGRLSADSPETEAILDATQQAAAAAAPDLMNLIAAMPATVADEVLRRLALEGVTKRRDLTADTKRQHMETVRLFFGGRCPCCGETGVMDGAERLPGSHFDHWTDNAAKNRADQTWLVCAACNVGFQTRRLPRENCRVQFDYFQTRRRQLARQGELNVFLPD